MKDNASITNCKATNVGGAIIGGMLGLTVGPVNSNHFKTLPLGENHYATSGELVISATDLAKFGIILAGDGSYKYIQFLDPESVKELNAPYIQAIGCKQASGIRLYKDNIVAGRTIYGQPGQQYGMVAGIYYDRSDKSGVVICTNGANIAKYGNGVYKINDDIVKYAYKNII